MLSQTACFHSWAGGENTGLTTPATSVWYTEGKGGPLQIQKEEAAALLTDVLSECCENLENFSTPLQGGGC